MSKRKTPDDKTLKSLYLIDKLSSGQIANKFNMSRTCVCRHLKKLGITRPESGEDSRNRNYNIKVFRSGYPVTFKPNHPRSNHLGYVFDHVLEWEKNTGHTPNKKEPIHHIDLDRTNSNFSNLYLCKIPLIHQVVHRSLEKVTKELIKNGIIKFKEGKYYYAHSD